MSKIKAGILGASGYTGADLVRLLSEHPNVEISVLTANAQADKPYGDIYPHLAHLNLPKTKKIEDADFSDCDVVFCGLPHGTTHDLIAKLPPHTKVVDLSADFRIKKTDTYEEWYGVIHTAKELQKSAVYGLTEHYREDIKDARLVACPGCYPTATLLSLVPLAKKGLIIGEDIIIDAKSGVTGAGRGVNQTTLFCEISDGMHPYGVASHRHAPEIEQEISKALGSDVIVNFTPHLIPMNRGEMVTIYVKRPKGVSHDDLLNGLKDSYKDEKFVNVIDGMPQTRFVRGSNYCIIGAKQDRIEGRSIIVATLDNLVKGSSGQAIQNMNLMFGYAEEIGLCQQPMFP